MTRTRNSDPALSTAVRPLRDGEGRAHRRRGRLAALVLAAATSFVAPQAALAQEAQADALLKDGKKLMGAGKLAEACPKLEESQKLAPRSSTLLEVAICHEKQGKIATAWTEYIDVEGEARKEGRSKLEADAKQRSRKLDGKLPRITVAVAQPAEGLEIKLDGASIDKADWGKSRPLDPGEHKLTASAPGRKPWEQAVTIKVAERKNVSVPALAEDPNGTAAAPATPAATPSASAPAQPPAGQPPVAGQPPAPSVPEENTRKAGRVVVEVSAMGGLLLGVIEPGNLAGLNTYDYTYNVKDGVYVELCGDDKCHGVFDPALGGYAGAQAFVGYALKETFHIGARLHGGVRIGGGYVLLGGPSASLKLDAPIWLGLSLLVGGVQQTSTIKQTPTITGIRGQIPAEFVPYNNGQDEVNVPRKANTPDTGDVGTFAFGGSLEVSYILFDRPRSQSLTSGALMVSAWPTFLKGLDGFAVSLPIGIGYRFY